MYKGVIAFILLQLTALGIVGYYPQLVNYLPKRLQLTADTAPPPRNPKLSHCVEQFVTEQFAKNGDSIRSSIDTARALDYSMLPDKLGKSVTESFDHAEKSITLLADANNSEEIVNQGAADFRPVHSQVRDIRITAGRIASEIEEKNNLIRSLDDDSAAKDDLLKEIEELTAERESIEATTPENWESARNNYTELQQTERKQRTDFRKSADKGYQPIVDLQNTLAATPDLKSLGGEFQILKDLIATDSNNHEQAIDTLAASAKSFGKVEGASKIKSAISKARKALKAKKPNPEKAAKALADAEEEYLAEMQWREQATSAIGPQIAEYEETIRSTIGIRQQQQLSKDQALYVAACDAGHRDISLNF